jgi:tRNA threonylcarbamoyladenosine biosynthesis protein TsaB
MTPTYTLAIESATNRGSVSLLKGEEEIGCWAGDDRETLSSALLPQISRLLSENNLSTGDLHLIAACSGPGSFTGVRVGLAAAKGIQTALGIPAIGIPLTQALALSIENIEQGVTAVIPAGRDEVYVQAFDKARISSRDIYLSAAGDIASLADSTAIVATRDLKDAHLEGIGEITVAPDNLARFVGLLAVRAYADGRDDGYPLRPLYIKEFGQ